jgi:enoyl-CoA hydratase/carnithine racemase
LRRKSQNVGKSGPEHKKDSFASRTFQSAEGEGVRTMSLNLEAIETRLEDRVLFASLNVPPLNLLGQTIIHDLVDLVQHVETNDDIRVVVFRSSVPNYFISHFDMTQLDEVRQQLTRAMLEPSLGVFFKRLSTLKQVSIAEIAGRVRGAGSELILACDMRFAARDSALFAHPEAGVGAVPGAGAIQHLSRLLGRSGALEALLGADDFSAELAERYGWINRVLPDAELRSFVERLAYRIAAFPPATVQNIKNRIAEMTLPSETELRTDGRLSIASLREPETQKRLKALFALGLQSSWEFEMNLGHALGELPSD